MAASRSKLHSVRVRLPFSGKREDGQALVELALVLPFVLVPILFGIIDFGHAVSDYNAMTNLANVGARVAAVESLPSSGTCSPSGTLPSGFSYHNPPTIQDYVNCWAKVEGAGLYNNVTTCVYTNGAASGSGATASPGAQGTPVQVNVSFSYPVINVLHYIRATIPISSSATMRLESAYSSSSTTLISNNSQGPGTC
jgi:hypothetical protein